MIVEKVKDHKDLVKVDKSYIVNTDDDQYHAALRRRIAANREKEIESRIAAIEDKQDLILSLLNKVVQCQQAN